MTIIAFDPGISTGVAIHTGEKTSIEGFPKIEITYMPDQYFTVVIKQVTDIWDVIDHHQPQTIICENFASGGLISTYGQQTLRLIGALEVIAFRHNIAFMLQYPSEIHKNPALMARAKQLIAQTKRTPIVHEIDAMAHLLLFEDRVAKGVADRYLKARQRQI